MSKSGLLYKLTIPDPNSQDEGQDDGSEFILHAQDDEKPVVLLLGWAGAEDRYLSVYSRIYESKGLITLRCITPIKTMFLKKRKMPLIGEEIVSHLENLKIGKRPIFVHCFSNGGSFMYQHFAEAVRNSPEPLQVKGVIFDSAPSRRRLSTFYRALRPIIGGSPFVNIPITLFLLLCCIFMWTWEFIQIRVLKRKIVQFKPLNNLLDEENKWPQHFIYSETDKVVPHEDVEYFANHRKSLGIDVSMKCFKDTPHVKHYPAHKVCYTQSVFGFMEKCLDLSMV